MEYNAPSSTGGDRLRVLFVPDELLVPQLCETFLRRSTLTPRSAEDFTEALAIAQTFEPHLIVVRNEIGGESAASFCVRVRRAMHPRAPKILLLTDHLRSDVGAAADIACDAHLVGPVGSEQLLSTMAELLSMQRRRGERVPIDVLVHTEGFSDERVPVDATLSTAIMLSEDSVVIEASRMLTVGATGSLQFFLPGSDERLALGARVRVAVDEVRLLYVLEFLDLAPQHRAQIRRYVESNEEAA